MAPQETFPLKWAPSSGLPAYIFATDFFNKVRKRSQGSNAKFFGCIALLAFLVLSIGFFLITRNSASKTKNHIQVENVREPVSTHVVQTNDSQISVVKEKSKKTGKERLDELGITVEDNGIVTDTNVTKAAKSKRKPTFASPTEMILSRIFSTKLGHPPPPVPHIPAFDMAKIEDILTRATPVNAADAEEVREMKEWADLAKKELLAFLKEGGTESEFMNYYQGKLKQSFEDWKEAQRAVADMAKGGDVEMVKEYVQMINEIHDKKGLRQVIVPPWMLKGEQNVSNRSNNEN